MLIERKFILLQGDISKMSFKFWLLLLIFDQIVPDLLILILITSFCLCVYNDDLMFSSSLWNGTWIIWFIFFQLLFSTESVFYIIFFEQLQESKHLVSLELDKDDTIKNNQCHKGDHSCKKIFGKVGLSLTRQDKY